MKNVYVKKVLPLYFCKNISLICTLGVTDLKPWWTLIYSHSWLKMGCVSCPIDSGFHVSFGLKHVRVFTCKHAPLHTLVLQCVVCILSPAHLSTQLL